MDNSLRMFMINMIWVEKGGIMGTESSIGLSYSDILSVIGAAMTAFSVVFGVFVYTRSSHHEKVRKTLDYWESINQELKIEKKKLLDKYGSKLSRETAEEILESSDDMIKLNKVLNIYERLSIGVNMGIYDIKALNRIVGRNLISNYSRYEEYIELRRDRFDRPDAWKDFEVMVGRINALSAKSKSR
jgi:hypothetical protein